MLNVYCTSFLIMKILLVLIGLKIINYIFEAGTPLVALFANALFSNRYPCVLAQIGHRSLIHIDVTRKIAITSVLVMQYSLLEGTIRKRALTELISLTMAHHLSRTIILRNNFYL